MQKRTDIPPHRVLPATEANLQKQVFKYVDDKLYKKALKTVNAILKKFPNHGETLCLKGYILIIKSKKRIDEREKEIDRDDPVKEKERQREKDREIASERESGAEGWTVLKNGLKRDITSRVCWRLFGLAHKENKNMKQAVQSLSKAVKIPTGNATDDLYILREIVQFQFLIKDFEGMTESAKKILNLNPKQKENWAVYSFSLFLNEKSKEALNVLNVYDDSQKDIYLKDQLSASSATALSRNEKIKTRNRLFFRSELALFQLTLLERSHQPLLALKLLDQKKNFIKNKFLLSELKARLSVDAFLTDPTDELQQQAEQACRLFCADSSENFDSLMLLFTALKIFPANKKESFVRRYKEAGTAPSLSSFIHLFDVSQLSEAQREAALAEIGKLMATNEKFYSFLSLLFTPLSQSLSLILNEFASKLRRGTESLYSSMFTLFCLSKTHGRAVRFLSLFIFNHLAQHNQFPKFEAIKQSAPFFADSTETKAVEQKSETPSTVFWMAYFVARQSLDWGDLHSALSFSLGGYLHTPSCVPLIALHAKIFSQLRSYKFSAFLLEKARQLDLADRHLNAKTAKKFWKAHNDQQAVEVMAAFVKQGEEAKVYYRDYECAFFELHRAEHFLAKGDFVMAEQQFSSVLRHFDGLAEANLEFLFYSARKGTLCSMIDLLNFHENIYCSPEWTKAALGAISMYSRLLGQENQKELAQQQQAERLTHMSESDRKKFLKKLRKEEYKRQQQEQQAAGGAGGASAGAASTEPAATAPTSKALYTGKLLELVRKLSDRPLAVRSFDDLAVCMRTFLVLGKPLRSLQTFHLIERKLSTVHENERPLVGPAFLENCRVNLLICLDTHLSFSFSETVQVNQEKRATTENRPGDQFLIEQRKKIDSNSLLDIVSKHLDENQCSLDLFVALFDTLLSDCRIPATFLASLMPKCMALVRKFTAKIKEESLGLEKKDKIAFFMEQLREAVTPESIAANQEYSLATLAKALAVDGNCVPRASLYDEPAVAHPKSVVRQLERLGELLFGQLSVVEADGPQKPVIEQFFAAVAEWLPYVDKLQELSSAVAQSASQKNEN